MDCQNQARVNRGGIAVAGNLIVDFVKNIAAYPAMGMLTNIYDISQGVGGCAANTSVDLAKLDPDLPLTVLGRIGSDESGRFVTGTLEQYGIKTDRIKVSDSEPTSFTDVMSLPSGERTFFHKRGANAAFSPADIDLDTLACDIFHIGYILLLDAFDREDPEYGTVMARFLCDLQARGIKTSIDIVSSDDLDAYEKKIVPALKYTDYVIINEVEACGIWHLEPRLPDGSIHKENVRTAMRKIAEAGTRERVVVHAKEMGFCLDVPTGRMTELPSLKLNPADIKGSVGAGDAFCAGSLYAIYHQYDDEKLLSFASAVAATSLFEANATDGIRPYREVLAFAEKCQRSKI